MIDIGYLNSWKGTVSVNQYVEYIFNSADLVTISGIGSQDNLY